MKAWPLFYIFTVKAETKNFVEGELSNITMPEMRGAEGRFQYTIKEYVYISCTGFPLSWKSCLNRRPHVVIHTQTP